MATQIGLTELKETLRDFESKVDAPVSVDDSCRRDQWQTDILAAFEHLTDLIERRRQEIHATLFVEIASQKASERDSINQLRHSDMRIGEFLDVVKAHLAAFAIGADEDGEGPAVEGLDVEGQVVELRDASRALCCSVLAQEEAVISWFAESFDPNA